MPPAHTTIESATAVISRDVIRVSGPDASDFLQGQLTQDVQNLEAGGSRWSFLLEPQGKTVALLRVTRIAVNDYTLDFDGGFADVVDARLRRFRLRVRCTIEPMQWHCMRMLGEQAIRPEGTELSVAVGLPGVHGFDGFYAMPPAILASWDADRYELWRIRTGIPHMGLEIVPNVIPQETGLTSFTVSFGKGCYTGQELVARIDSRGHVNRLLRGVVASRELTAGTLLFDDTGKEVGSVTSAAGSDADGYVALSYVRREIVDGAEVNISLGSERSPARVVGLPLLS